MTEGTKRCPRCGDTKPLTDFHKNKSTRSGVQGYCKACAYLIQQEYLERNAELVALRRTQALLEPVGIDKTKLCRGCQQEKPLLEFYAHRSTKDKRATYCKVCAKVKDRERRAQDHEGYKQYLREWREMNREQQKRSMRNWRLKVYGLTPDDYIDMYEQQEGKCLLCGESGETFGGRRLHIDHDHETGKVRGLLCGLCNAGIGMLKDSPDLLRLAASYIEEARTP